MPAVIKTHMARQMRINVAEGLYHVTSRGTERTDIVLDDRDRKRWLDRFAETAINHNWRVISWALLDNHYHVYLCTPECNLSSGMHDLNSGHAVFFNRRHKRVGPLFQGRFKSILVEDAGHDWELSRYIHLNPVRAGIVSEPTNYLWSSLRAVLGLEDSPKWLDTKGLLSNFGKSTSQARHEYKRYLQEGLKRGVSSPLVGVRFDSVLGSEAFIENLKITMDMGRHDRDVSRSKDLVARHSPATVEKVVLAEYDEPMEALRARSLWKNEARLVAAYLLRKHVMLPLEEIGDRLGGVGRAAVSIMVSKVKKALETDSRMRAKISKCERTLENFKL
jgi:REP element-mobilizing transposase RayT